MFIIPTCANPANSTLTCVTIARKLTVSVATLHPNALLHSLFFSIGKFSTTIPDELMPYEEKLTPAFFSLRERVIKFIQGGCKVVLIAVVP